MGTFYQSCFRVLGTFRPIRGRSTRGRFDWGRFDLHPSKDLLLLLLLPFTSLLQHSEDYARYCMCRSTLKQFPLMRFEFYKVL